MLGVNMGRGGETEVCGLGLEGRGKEPSEVASLKLLAVAVGHSVCVGCIMVCCESHGAVDGKAKCRGSQVR